MAPLRVPIRAVILTLTTVLPVSAAAQNISPYRVFGRYQQTVWQEQHGLPQNTVNAITSTRAGYLWLGTHDGAARFDGVQFTGYDATNTREIQGTIVLSALEDRAGVLWLATDNGGLTRYEHGRFTTLTTADGLLDNHPRVLFEDRRGDLWIGSTAGLSRYRNGRLTHFTDKDGLPHAYVVALAEDGEGQLWVGTAGGLARLKDDRVTAYTVRDGVPPGVIRALCWDAGQLWIGSERGLSRWASGQFTSSERGDWPNTRVTALSVDRDGALWVGTLDRGLLRESGGRLVPYTTADGLPSDAVRSIYQDPDGAMWVGTGAGLVRLRTPRVSVLNTGDGLARDYSTSLHRGEADEMWIAGDYGLTRYHDGRLRRYVTADGLPTTVIAAIASDTRGRTIVAANRTIVAFEGDGFKSLYALPPQSSPARALIVDRSGGLWVGTADTGVIAQHGGQTRTYSRANGLRDDSVLALHQDRAGAVWVGTLRGGVSRIADGRVTTWTVNEGLAHNQVLSFYEERGGALWAGTHGGGLTRFKDGRLATVGVTAGLFNGVVFRMLEDDSGYLWMSCNKGIFRVSLKDLNAVADGIQSRVTSTAYGIADGLPSSDCNQGFPGGDRRRDGTLWFPTSRGVVVVDPRKRESRPPRVVIEGMTLDRVPVSTAERPQIQSGSRNLEIAYTGLSWARPDQIRFKYRLTGLDDSWQDPGRRRTAYYSYLPPGSYTFTVIADNGDGVWNTEGASLQFTVLPAFYQTGWFQAGAASMLAAAVLVAWHRRARQFRLAQAIRQSFSRQLIESQEHERKRIAGELHDGLGQHLVLIRNLALLQRESAVDGAGQTLQDIADEASRALGEVRTISYNLRPYQLDRLGLTKALESVVTAASQGSNTTFTTMIDDVEGAVAKDREIDVYRLVQEAINNIVKHAAATEATISAERRGPSLRMTIHDNGRGFVPGATRPEPGSGGFGLMGLSERAQLLGGSLTVTSAPGEGTTLLIDLPVSSANTRE